MGKLLLKMHVMIVVSYDESNGRKFLRNAYGCRLMFS